MSRNKLRLYGMVLQEENIRQAIKEVNSYKGSKIPGPDGINKYNNFDIDIIIKEVKLRLRRRKKVCSRIIKILKDNGDIRKLTVINYFDRIAQQAVKRVISPVIEPKQSIYSFGFRQGIGAKIAASRVANCIRNIPNIHSVEIDIKSCFDNIRLDMALNCLRELGVTDGKLLQTIKHLMFVSRNYQGVGLEQGTILGPLLCNCVLNKLDRYMEDTFELNNVQNYAQAYRRHKGEWIKWHEALKRKLSIRYIRFADDIFIACHNEEEPEYVKSKVKEFIENVLKLKVNEEKTKIRTNGFEYLGFKFITEKFKNRKNIWIRMKDEKKYIKKLGDFHFRTNKNFYDFLLWFRGVLYYFDICNDLSKFLNKTTTRLYTRSTKNTSVIKQESSSVYVCREGRKKVEVDIYEWRKNSRTSYAEYMYGSFWIKEREKIKTLPYENEYRIYAYMLYTRQKGLSEVTGKRLDINNMCIHHIKPRKAQGRNEINNLILVETEIHKEIHYGTSKEFKIEKYRKQLNKE